MSKSDLKAAMESLQVKKPLKLFNKPPQFKAPPIIPESTLDPAETQVDPRTQVAVATEVPLQTMVPVTTQVAAPTEVVQATQVPMETQVGIETPVAATTQVPTETEVPLQTMVTVETQVPRQTPVDAPTPVARQTQVAPQTLVPEQTKVTPDEDARRSASDQDSSVTLEVQCAPKLHQGYTRLPNSFLMRMASGDLLRSEMQILLLIARFTISFQKRHAPLSKAVLERQSGLRGPAVLQAISELQAKGLIEKIPGDQHRPNQLGLVFDDEWEFFSKSKVPNTLVPTQTQVAAAAMVSVATPVAIETPAPVAVPTPAVVPAATYFKDTKTIKNKLSLTQLPEALQKYFDELKPAKKREGEWQAFESLQGDYRPEDISECLEHLQERGIKRRGPNGEEFQPCHSPMAYLAKAMGEIFGEVESRRKKASERIEREWQDAEAARKFMEIEEREASEWAVKERAFGNALPEEKQQLEVIARLLGNLPIRPNSQVGRRMGIGLWWDALTEPERTKC